MKKNQELFDQLRTKYPYFRYKRFEIEEGKHQYTMRFHFSLADKFDFHPVLMIPKMPAFRNLNEDQWNLFTFNIGMVEVVSYWKAACSPTLYIEPYSLTDAQVQWWKKLYFHGLGEFFYQNNINTSHDSFISINSGRKQMPSPSKSSSRDGIIVPVGGGKDSAVTLELLKASGKELLPMAINPRAAIIETIENAGISTAKLLKVTRQIDSRLIELNSQGFLNGHTPFSAIVAFTSSLLSELTGVRKIALSNESSANEPTIPGTMVNHQYSKSFEFETDFRVYSKEHLHADLNYFSFLRPLNEMQIARLFSGLKHHYYSFKSCNVGSKDNIWCGECPKCLFTAIILSPWIDREKLKKIFGKDILDDPALKPAFNQLTGQTPEKPFECVGTIDEVRASVHLAKEAWQKPLPALFNSDGPINLDNRLIDSLQKKTGTTHHVPDNLMRILLEKNQQTW